MAATDRKLFHRGPDGKRVEITLAEYDALRAKAAEEENRKKEEALKLYQSSRKSTGTSVSVRV